MQISGLQIFEIIVAVVAILAVILFPCDINQETLRFTVQCFLVVVIAVAAGVIVSFQSREGFLFELTPQKQCDGGPYMYSSNPQKQALCSQFSKKDLSRYECGPGFDGRPVWWNYSPESNSEWKNGRCSQIGIPPTDPQVL